MAKETTKKALIRRINFDMIEIRYLEQRLEYFRHELEDHKEWLRIMEEEVNND